MQAGDLLFSRRIRQNHALEHATVTLLTREQPSLAVSARANSRGFTIFANLDPLLVRRRCDEALARVRAGESSLAIHPNCGTNLAVGMSLAMIGSLFGLTALHPRTRVASAIGSLFTGLVLARPLGRLVQRHITTLADLGDMRILSVTSRRLWGRQVVEVLTAVS
ncbi:MAG: DUF6391 domain-containing protein [Ktedonobacterales bacterium]